MINEKLKPNNSVSLHSAPGQDVRRLRKSRGLTLTDMARALNRSVGFISQVERGLSVPSIDDLRAIARVLDVPVSWFFASENLVESEKGLIARAGHRRSLGTKEAGLTEELLSPEIGGSFGMFRSVFQAGAESNGEIFRQTEETGYVVSGQFDIWIDEKFFELTAGDSFHLGHKPYRWRNNGTEPAILIWVVSPPVY